MATTPAAAKVQPSAADEDLTDEQIDQLLARATARLKDKSKADSQDVLKLAAEDTYTFPKLEPCKLEKPYVTQKDGLAAVDGPRLVEERQRKQATNGVRKVTDPVAVKRMAIEVSHNPSIDVCCNEENLSHIILSGVRAPLWLALLHL